MSDLTDYLQTATEAARLGGDVLAEWAGRFTVSEKSPANLVTEADLASQRAVYERIRGRYPDHNFLGEEGLHHTGRPSGYRWVIDPLDGTSNYVHRFPYYAVSIALEHDGELQVGVIFDPNRDELFAARRGEGATLTAGCSSPAFSEKPGFSTGRPIVPSRVETIGKAMVVASLPAGARRDDPAVDRLLRVMERAQTVQRLGSAALSLAYVAAGRMDAFFSSSLKPWDVAAGALIVAEAGGRVTKMSGAELDIEVPDLLATNGTSLHEELVEILRG